jgi:hypothetical protein
MITKTEQYFRYKEFYMKNVLLVIVSYLLLFMISSCITTTNVVPLIYTNNQNTEFEILGTFTHKSTIPMGYVDIYNIAKTRYPETDFVIDIVIDQHIIKTSYHIIVFLLKQIFSADFGKTETVKYEYVMRGTAIQYMQKKYNIQEISIPADNASVTTITIVAEKYTVKDIIGDVTQFVATRWVSIKVGDVLTKETHIYIPRKSSLVLIDDSTNTTITIPGRQNGRIDKLILNL